MSHAASVLARIRAAGISIHAEGGRLIVEARLGVISSEVRAELAQRKSELIQALVEEQRRPERGVDDVTEAVAEVARLLVIAYQRYTKVQRVPLGQVDSVNKELALSPGVSVHGHGQPL
jgi:hypothetical protein